MQAVGITVEYNPFHNGHLHHATKAKELSNADVVIAVMSGQFLQRGEPAIVDKWTRATMALQHGVDIVIELPYVFSTGVAERFANGAIHLLASIGCQSFAFGNETGTSKDFYHTVNIINNNKLAYDNTIAAAMKTGMSYPRAMAEAFTAITTEQCIDLTEPNNILGFHYVKASLEQRTAMNAIAIPRQQAHYHDEKLPTFGQIASATSMRMALAKNNSVAPFMPALAHEALQRAPHASWHDFYPYLRHTLLQWPASTIAQFADVNEGIEFALKKAALHENNFEDFLARISSKRYTRARLQRMLTHILTATTQRERDSFTTPTYLRLLGMTKNGQNYLSHYKKATSLPIISRAASSDDASLALDCKASAIYALATNQTLSDYNTPPIRL